MNHILFVVDDLTPRSLSCYGGPPGVTPRLDEFAEDGIRYTSCFSAATWTRPSSASILTGCYPPTHGIQRYVDAYSFTGTAIPEVFPEATSKGFTATGQVSSPAGYDEPFDEWVDVFKEPSVIAKNETYRAEDHGFNFESETETAVTIPRAEDLNDYLFQWVEAVEEPFFAFVWTLDVHAPQDPPDEFHPNPDRSNDEVDHRSLYQGEVAYTDSEFGRLLDKLRSLDIYDETNVVFTSDHGEGIERRHGVTHGGDPYEELIHVPLVVKPAESADWRPQTVDSLTSLIDLLPLFCALAGEPVPDSCQGVIPKPWGTWSEEDRYVYSEEHIPDKATTRAGRVLVSLRSDTWKHMTEIPAYRLRFESNEYIGRTIYETKSGIDFLRSILFAYERERMDALFDLAVEPEELTNVIEQNRTVADRFRENLSELLAECRRLHESIPDADGERAEVDGATKKQLEELGYY